MKLNLRNKKIEKCLTKQHLSEQSTWTKCYGLEKLGLLEGEYIGTAESDTRVYELRVYKNDTSMVRIHNQSQWIIELTGKENEADRLEKIATGKWLLEKGVIDEKIALEQYGYKI